MPETKPIDHQAIEEAFTAPKRVLELMPDCIESREAKRLMPIVEDLVHVAHEKVRYEEPES